MPIYNYQARRAAGDKVTGTKEAVNRQVLKEELAVNGLLLVDASVLRAPLVKSLRPARVSLPALLGFLREFRHLVDAGLAPGRCLEILKERPNNPVFAAAIAGMHDGVARGLPLDKAAATQAQTFDVVFQAALRAGVRTSQLGLALARLESFLSIRHELNRKIRKAMAYPLFLLALLVVVLAVLMLFVLPRFADLYAEFGSELPAATRLLIGAVNAAPLWVPGSAIIVFAAGLWFRRAMRTPHSRRKLDRVFLWLPFVGAILRDIQLVQVSYMMAMLLKAGTPVRDALIFVSDSLSNAVIRDEIKQVAAAVETGKSLSESANDIGLYPPLTLNMLRAGEVSGALPDLMDAVATVHEQSVEDSLSSLLAIIEPAMMLLVGIVLGAVIITVYLPVFGISGVVQ